MFRVQGSAIIRFIVRAREFVVSEMVILKALTTSTRRAMTRCHNNHLLPYVPNASRTHLGTPIPNARMPTGCGRKLALRAREAGRSCSSAGPGGVSILSCKSAKPTRKPKFASEKEPKH